MATTFAALFGYALPAWLEVLAAVVLVVGALAFAAWVEARRAWPGCPQCGRRGAAHVERNVYRCRAGHLFHATRGAERCTRCGGPMAEEKQGHRCRQCRSWHTVV